MPNMDPWINQNEAINEFEKQLLSIRDERQEMIRPNCHPTYNERHQKIIELIDWALLNSRDNTENAQNEKIITDNIIKELDKKRNIALHKMKKAMLKDDVSMYRLRNYFRLCSIQNS